MIESRESLQITKSLVIPGENGRDIRVATVTGNVTPGRSMSMNMVFVDVETAMKNKEAMAGALDAFLNNIRELARINGLPV